MKLTFYLLTIFLLSCNLSNREREIIIDEEYAKGNISKDSVFNGRIKFYDLTNHKLTSEADYRDGVLHGRKLLYFNSGKIRSDIEYRDGQQSGVTIFYDDDGNITDKQFFYYGFRVGDGIHYEGGKIKDYTFECLEGETLLYLHYDSIGTRPIDSIQEKLFFFNTNNYVQHVLNKKEEKTEITLYLLNPPKYKFDYTVLLVDNEYNIKDTLHSFSEEHFERVVLDTKKEKDGLFLAVGLQITDSINKKDLRYAKMIFDEPVKHETN